MLPQSPFQCIYSLTRIPPSTWNRICRIGIKAANEKMFNTADRILNRIDSPRYFLYGGTNRRKICKNSFIGANIVLFKKTAKLLAVFLVYILFFLSEESFYSEKAVLMSLGLLLYFFSEESSRGRTGDANLHELSDMVVTLINDNRLVLFCSTHHLLAATLAEVLDEDGEYLALILLFCSALTFGICNLISSLRRAILVSSETLSGRCLAA